VADANLNEIRPGATDVRRSPRDLAPLFRLGAVIEAVPGLAVSASVASATRLPTLRELFGDRGFALGNVELEPERSTSVEAGMVAAGRVGILGGQAELRGFGLFARNLIRFERNERDQLVPTNTDEAILAGAELGLRGRLTRYFRWANAFTYLFTTDRTTGKELPLRPDFQIYSRPEVMIGPYGWLSRLTFFGDFTYVSANLAEEEGVEEIPKRILLGAGFAMDLFDDVALLAFTVRDILDERPVDLAGFPLAGRSFRAELTLRTP
jgi:iron complex outermembrane receptor protein